MLYLWKNAPGHQKYLSEEALKLAKWAIDTNSRPKALKMKRIADKMEDKKREHHKSSFKFYDDLYY